MKRRTYTSCFNRIWILTLVLAVCLSTLSVFASATSWWQTNDGNGAAYEGGDISIPITQVTSQKGVTVTIEEANPESLYAAYRLLDVTDIGNGEFVYKLNSKYASIIKGVTNKTSDSAAIAYISLLSDAQTRNFADAVYAQIRSAGLEADHECTPYEEIAVFNMIPRGYYMLTEKQTGGTGDTTSLAILKSAGAEFTAVSEKEDEPTVEKKIIKGSERVDYIDAAYNDKITFQIVGTVSDHYNDYKSYYYCFEDTMDTGLVLSASSIKIYIGTTDVTSQFQINTDEKSFTAEANLKELTGVAVTKGTQILVNYEASVGAQAVHTKTGNQNTVVLKYERDPYHTGDGDPTTADKSDDPGETPSDIVAVFAFAVNVNKVDDAGNPLPGAGFKLYKKEDGVWNTVHTKTDDPSATTFAFNGLSAGTYKLEEAVVPPGYNKADNIIFVIEPKYQQVDGVTVRSNLIIKNTMGTVISGEGELFAVNNPNGTASVSVENRAGTELPSTGGIGTTVFYIVGGMLVLAAAVLLITKKRMVNAE